MSDIIDKKAVFEAKVSKIHQMQVRFSLLNSQVPVWAQAHGYEVTEGDSYRDPKYAKVCGYYHEWSYHCRRLAKDWNLFKDGVLLSKNSDYKPLGDWWESLDPLCTWGGRWDDGNHLSYGEGKGVV